MAASSTRSRPSPIPMASARTCWRPSASSTSACCAGRAATSPPTTIGATASGRATSQGEDGLKMRTLVVLLALGWAAARTAEPELLALAGDLGTHDPAIIRAGNTYYVFCTGRVPGGGGIIPIRFSKDLRNWKLSGAVFDKLPEWVAKEVPKARDAWAPDISFFNGKFRLYYSLSSFGVNESAIGLATNLTLDPKSPKYQWVDEGLVVHSRTGQDDFNTIDPNLVIENKNTAWLNWGSFWGGIKMKRIDAKTGKLSSKDTTLYSLASRPRLKPHVTPPVEGAIEAPFLVRRNGWWYLFVSFDFCCRGVRSDYNVVVGRSRKVTGPYRAPFAT